MEIQAADMLRATEISGVVRLKLDLTPAVLPDLAREPEQRGKQEKEQKCYKLLGRQQKLAEVRDQEAAGSTRWKKHAWEQNCA